MKLCIMKVCLCFALFSLLGINQVWAKSPIVLIELEEEYSKAEVLMRSFKNDEALLILNVLEKELTDNGEINSPLGIKVQLRQAEALEKDHQDEIAIQKLLHVLELSKLKSQWKVLSNTHLSLARLHEKMDRHQNCLTHLNLAKKYIEEHSLQDVYPRFAVRFSSYHRIFANRDSALFYAHEVLRTAPNFNLYDEVGTGHLLLGMLLRDSAYHLSAEHFKTAGKIWLKTGDYSGYSFTHNNLSHLHLHYNRPHLALLYNDSTLLAAVKSFEMGNEKQTILPSTYRHRAAIFKELGQLDSALLYLDKGYQLELAAVIQSKNNEVVEIDARYQNEKKMEKIAEQDALIQHERERKIISWGIIALVSIFTGILALYYFRLQSANRKMIKQTSIINQTNDDLSVALKQQIMLQGEVHHRVKNNLQVIVSLLELQKEEIADPQARKSLESMSNRIYSMAAIHEILHQRDSKEFISLSDYAQTLCQHFSNFSETGNAPNFQLDFDNQKFNLQTLMPLGIILNELLTNSFKYAKNLGQQLNIAIKLKKMDEGFCILYRDNGPGFPKGVLVEREGGLGTYLLNSMSRQLQGHLISNNDGGAVSRIFFKEKFQ